MTDIHNLPRRLERIRANIQASDDISAEDTETINRFTQWQRKEGLSTARIHRYLQSAKKIAEYNDFGLLPMTEEKLLTLVEQIDASAYYHDEYTPSTKREFYKFCRTFCKFADGLSVDSDVPDRADLVPTTTEEEYTKPNELIKPAHIRAACRNITNLRDQAFLLTQWDTGSRIGETAACKVGDFYEQNGRWMLHIHGNKESPDRDAWVHLAAPAINRWLEEAHPEPDNADAYIFCKLAPKDPATTPCYNRFRGIAAKAKQAAGIGKNLQRTHLFRKSRVSYLKSAMNMAESAIDKRIGHVMNSDRTRRYTRIGDTESNRNYGDQYGLSVDETKDEDLLPQECERCREVNAGFRDRCYECDGPLDALAHPAQEDQTDLVKAKIIDAMREEGMLDELQEVLADL